MKFLTLPTAFAALMLCINKTEAHSWVEKLIRIASNGTFVGPPGYPRGFVPRSSPGFSDFVSEHQIPPDGRATATEILPTDLICRPSQTTANQTEGSPALIAAPGDNIALIYQENGHVTLLDRSPTKPVGSGTVFIYGTKKPSDSDTYLGIHRVWNTKGTGGDKRGKLIATRPFDDGQCYQNNTSPLAESRRDEFGTVGNDLHCQTDVQLPQDAGTSGKYTLYWVWEWPTLDNVTGKVITNQSYTTCMDIVMTSKKLAHAGSFNSKQLVDSRAIERELSTPFLFNPTEPAQLTGAAGSQPTSSPSAGTAPLKAPSNDDGGAPSTGDRETVKTVTVTTTVCNCASTPSVDASRPSVEPFLPPVAGQQNQPVQSATVTPPASNSINFSTNFSINLAPATTNTAPISSQSTLVAGSARFSPHPVVQPFLNPNSVFIPGSIVTVATSTASETAPITPIATATTEDSQASTTSPAAQYTNTDAGGGSRRRRRNSRRVT